MTGFRGSRKIVDWSSFVIVLPSSSSWVNFQKAPLVFVDYPPSLVVVVAFCVFSRDLHRSLQVFCKICSFFSSILNKLLVLSSCFCAILSCNFYSLFFWLSILVVFLLVGGGGGVGKSWPPLRVLRDRTCPGSPASDRGLLWRVRAAVAAAAIAAVESSLGSLRKREGLERRSGGEAVKTRRRRSVGS